MFTAHHAILCGGTLEKAAEHYDRLKLFTLHNFVDRDTGLLLKPSSNIAGDNYMNGPFACQNGTSPCAGDLVDWPRSSRDNYSCEDVTTPIVSTVPNCYASMAMDQFADIAGWLNRSSDEALYRNAAADLRSKITSVLYNTTAGSFIDGLGYPHMAVHASIIAAASGVITTGQMADSVLAALEARGLYTGEVLTTCWIAGATLEGLYNMAAMSTDGRASDVALQYMSRTGKRSWLAMIHDWTATMTMEAWSPFDNTGGPGSGTGGEGITFSHPWCSSPANVIPRLLMGISPLARGWARALVRPQPGSLKEGNLSLVLGEKGVLSVSVLQTERSFTVTLSIPAALGSVQVCLPQPWFHKGGLCQRLEVDGSTVVSKQEARFRCLVSDLRPNDTGKLITTVVRVCDDVRTTALLPRLKSNDELGLPQLHEMSAKWQEVKTCNHRGARRSCGPANVTVTVM